MHAYFTVLAKMIGNKNVYGLNKNCQLPKPVNSKLPIKSNFCWKKEKITILKVFIIHSKLRL